MSLRAQRGNLIANALTPCRFYTFLFALYSYEVASSLRFSQ
jgi:hypothetical protein